VHFGVEVFGWRKDVKAMLRVINDMLGLGWLPHQLSDGSDNVSTPVFDRALVTVMPFHMVQSV